MALGLNLALLPPGCVIIGELIDLAELQCPIYKMQIIDLHKWICLTEICWLFAMCQTLYQMPEK